MKEVIYLRVSRHKVEGMTKNLPYINRGEVPVKLILEVKDSAFKEPTIEKSVTIEDPLSGTDVAADIEFKGSVITEDEAKKIKAMRIERMAEILRSEGFEITIPNKEDE